MKVINKPEITKFISALEAAGILRPGEADILARVFRKRGRRNWGAMAGVAATRAAHKKYGAGN